MRVARVFERCGVGYFLGGSLASSYQGEPRATNDIDFVVALDVGDVDALANALGEEFLVDRDELRRSVREGTAWNIVHLPTVTKVDLLMRGSGDYDRCEFERRERVAVRPGEHMYLKRAEDTVLRKLWFREGGEVSERQWRDVVGVLRHSRDQLDRAYLARWSRTLDLKALLSAAEKEADAD